jgi:hypothetical protein
VDNGSLANILYWLVFTQMGIDRESIKLFGSLLVGFAREQVQPIGLISLPIITGTTPKQVIVMVDFLVVDQPSTYNTIIGRPSLNKLKATTSTYHLKMKFSTDEGVEEVKGDQVAPRKCYNTSLKKPSRFVPLTISNVGSRNEGKLKGELAEELVEVFMGEGKITNPKNLRWPHWLSKGKYGGVCMHGHTKICLGLALRRLSIDVVNL